MPVWVRPAKDAQDVMMSELKINLLAGSFHTPPDVRRGHKKVQHRLLCWAFERSSLFNSFSEYLSHKPLTSSYFCGITRLFDAISSVSLSPNFFVDRDSWSQKRFSGTS